MDTHKKEQELIEQAKQYGFINENEEEFVKVDQVPKVTASDVMEIWNKAGGDSALLPSAEGEVDDMLQKLSFSTHTAFEDLGHIFFTKFGTDIAEVRKGQDEKETVFNAKAAGLQTFGVFEYIAMFKIMKKKAEEAINKFNRTYGR